MRSLIRVTGVAAVVAISSVALAPALTAQESAGPHWAAWNGCWRPLNAPLTASGDATSEVCVQPTAAGDGATFVVFENGQVKHREFVSSAGKHTPKQGDDCAGWESGVWSRDGRRLLLNSELSCGTTKVAASAVFAMTPTGDWLELRGSTMGGQTKVQAVRYRPTGRVLKGDPSAEVVAYTAESGSAKYSRREAGLPVSTDAVLEVSKAVATPVAEAWLNELQQGFKVSGRELTRLADAGLPSRVIDLMVALTYPEVFSVQHTAGTGVGLGAQATPRQIAEEQQRWMRNECSFGRMSSLYYFYDPYCSPTYLRYGMYGGYYTGYGYGNWYGYGPNGGYYWGTQPLIIVQGGPQTTSNAARADNGRGYTRGGSGSSSGTATHTQLTSPSGGSSGGSSGSSGSSSSGSSGSSSGSGRTAQPRNPPK